MENVEMSWAIEIAAGNAKVYRSAFVSSNNLCNNMWIFYTNILHDIRDYSTLIASVCEINYDISRVQL